MIQQLPQQRPREKIIIIIIILSPLFLNVIPTSGPWTVEMVLNTYSYVYTNYGNTVVIDTTRWFPHIRKWGVKSICVHVSYHHVVIKTNGKMAMWSMLRPLCVGCFHRSWVGPMHCMCHPYVKRWIFATWHGLSTELCSNSTWRLF